MAASIISGGIIFFLLGMLADKWLKHRIVLICVCSTILCALALPYLITTLWAWPLIVVFANSAFGIYVVGLAINGDRFKTNDLVPAAAAIGVMWGIGGLISPPIAGLIIDTFGYNAFPYYVSGLYGVLLAGLLANGGRVLRPLPKPST